MQDFEKPSFREIGLDEAAHNLSRITTWDKASCRKWLDISNAVGVDTKAAFETAKNLGVVMTADEGLALLRARMGDE